MSNDALSTSEEFHNTFFYFIEGLNVMAADAANQKASIGGVHVAWELQNDALDHGKAVLNLAGSFFQLQERADIVSLLDKVRKLPSDALGSDSTSLHHPQWVILRDEAARLIERLARPIAENQTFFNK